MHLHFVSITLLTPVSKRDFEQHCRISHPEGHALAMADTFGSIGPTFQH